jgi:MFS family permease
MAGIGDRLRTTLRVATEAARNPALRRAQLAFLGFNTLEYGSWVAILIYAYSATGPASVGVVAIAQLLPAAVFAPLGSMIADRYPRARVLLGAYLLLAGMTGTMALGMLTGWPPIAVYLVGVLSGAGLTLVRPAHNALLPSLARTTEELTAGNAVSSIAEAGGLLLGPLAAAAILAIATPGEVLGVLAVAVAMSAVFVAGLRSEPAPASDPVATPDSLRQAATAGFRALARDADARLLVAILAARTLVVGVTDVLFVLLAIDLFGTGESGAALLSASLGAGGIVGGGAAFMLVGRRRIAPVLLACATGWGLAFAAMGILANGSVAPLLLILGGTGLTIMDVAGRTILQRGVRDEVLARVFGILEGLMMAALAVGSILVPVVVAVVGLAGAVIVFAMLLPLVLALSWPRLRALDRHATVPERAIALLRMLRLFEALDPPAMETLGRAATWSTVPAGAMIIREGDPGDSFYALESGTVTVSRGGSPIRTLTGPGEGFGEIALLRDVPRTATVTADTAAVLLELGRAPFMAAVTGHPVTSARADLTIGRLLDADEEMARR